MGDFKDNLSRCSTSKSLTPFERGMLLRFEEKEPTEEFVRVEDDVDAEERGIVEGDVESKSEGERGRIELLNCTYRTYTHTGMQWPPNRSIIRKNAQAVS